MFVIRPMMTLLDTLGIHKREQKKKKFISKQQFV